MVLYIQNIPQNGFRYLLTKKRLIFVIGVGAFIVLLGSTLYFASLGNPPKQFPTHTGISIVEGASVPEIADLLMREHVIRSPLYFRLLFKTHFAHSYIHAGAYRFDEPLKTKEVLAILTDATRQSPLITVTIPEGFRVSTLLDYLPPAYADADIGSALPYEGYLFPDTYYIGASTSFDEIIAMMRENFSNKLSALDEQIKASSLTQEEVIIFASILEREANSQESMRTVSGILHKRLAIGMPLQVDATFEYLLGKGSAELTDEDLALDSPFNTYTHAGLPPAPIASPGLISIMAVLDPIESNFLYYLTSNDSTFYYAETFEEHKKNKQRYLR